MTEKGIEGFRIGISPKGKIMSLLLEHFQKTQDLLLSEFKASQQFQSSKILGDARELFIQEFLESHLPSKFYIGKSGEIIDCFGGHTEELDIIIYSENIPKLSVRRQNIYLREGVSLVIEVKSNLNSCELQRDIRKTKTIKSLKAVPILQSATFSDVIIEAPIIPVYIFAYKSINLEKIVEQIRNLNVEQCPEFIGVLEHGFIKKTKTDEGVEIKKNPDSVLAELFFYILDATSSWAYIRYDWSKYIK